MIHEGVTSYGSSSADENSSSEESGLSEAAEREAGEDDGVGDNLNEECQEGGEGGSDHTEQRGEPAGQLQTDQSDNQVFSSDQSL